MDGWKTDPNVNFENRNLIGICIAERVEIFRGDTQHTVTKAQTYST